MKTGKKYRGIKRVQVNNVCGYPSLTENIKSLASANSAILLFGTQALLELTKEQRLSSQLKVVIETLPLLLTAGIPVVGYQHLNGSWHKIPVVFQKYPKRKVEVHGAFKRLPIELQDRVINATKKRKVLKTFDSKSDEYKLVKGMFSPHLPASSLDKDPTNGNSKSGSDSTSD